MANFCSDVRDPDEVEEFGKLKNAVNIPLAQLRDRLAELPRDRRIVTYCQKGQRGYLAACALHGHGFEDVANLRGGFLQLRLLDDKRVEDRRASSVMMPRTPCRIPNRASRYRLSFWWPAIPFL